MSCYKKFIPNKPFLKKSNYSLFVFPLEMNLDILYNKWVKNQDYEAIRKNFGEKLLSYMKREGRTDILIKEKKSKS